MKFPKLRTPLATDLKRPTNVWSKVIIAAAPTSCIKPRTRSIDRSTVLKVSRLGRGWCVVQATKVGCGVFTTNRNQPAFIKIEKKWRVPYGQATCAAAIAR
jgi:hypothetical protein